jgi:hypothetical protein
LNELVQSRSHSDTETTAAVVVDELIVADPADA